MYIKECQPILEGLQGKTAKDECNAEYAEASLREIVGVVFDVGIHRRSRAGNDAGHQSQGNRKKPRWVHLIDEGAAEKGRDHVPDRADHRSPKLTACEAWAASR